VDITFSVYQDMQLLILILCERVTKKKSIKEYLSFVKEWWISYTH